MTGFNAAATGDEDSSGEDVSDKLYKLREFISLHAFGDFRQNQFDTQSLEEFDREIEQMIDDLSGVALEQGELSQLIGGIEKLGRVYSDLHTNSLGNEDGGHKVNYGAHVHTLNSLNDFFVLLTANMPAQPARAPVTEPA